MRLGRSWRSRLPLAEPPLVLSRRDGNTQRVDALDEGAEALKLRRGMGLADARAMHPRIEIVEADPEADRRLLEALADWCDRYTPLVALEGADGLFLDITGCAHLFGGEAAMLADARRRLGELGFDARVGVASTPGAAWAAARYELATVPPGGEKAALAPLPLAALRLEPALRQSLESVGLRTAAQIMAAPRAPLARRFGRMPVLRIDQALGEVEEAVSPRLPVPPLSVERALMEPLSRMEDVAELVLMLARTLKGDLERRGEGARRLVLALFRVDGVVSRIAVGTSRPMRDPVQIGRLFEERLKVLGETIETGYGFDLVRLSVLAAARFDDRQADLAGGGTDPGEDLAFFADRMRARLGGQAVLQAAMVQSHVPERAMQIVPFAASAHAAATQVAIADRPIRLFSRPEPVEVTAEVPEGPPARFRWRRVSYRVARAEGPERIAPEWWHAQDGGETRDYYRIEDEDGRRYWLYRDGFYGQGRPPGWYMQGIFA